METQELIINCDQDTQYRIEKRPNGLWSAGPELCIAHVFKGKRSRTNPSIPFGKVPELIEFLARAYKKMLADTNDS